MDRYFIMEGKLKDYAILTFLELPKKKSLLSKKSR